MLVVGCALLLTGCSGEGEGEDRPATAAHRTGEQVPALPVPRGDGSQLAARGDDFNGDGLRDLVLDDLVHDGHGDDAGIGIAYGTRRGIGAGARHLLVPAERAAPTKGERPAAFDAAASCDLDGDGFTDLVVATDPPYDGIGQPPVPVQLLFGSPGGLTGKAVKLAIPATARYGNEWPDQPVCGDFDGDGANDLVVHASNAQIGFLRGPFSSGKSKRGKAGAPRSGKVLKAPGTVLRGPALDVNRDGYDDFVVRASGGRSRSGLVLGGPAGPTRTGAVFPAGQDLAFGAFGWGAARDAAVATGPKGPGIVLRYDLPGTRRSTLAAPGAPAATVRATVRAGDFDGDGRAELVVATGRSAELRVHTGRTRGPSAAAVTTVSPPADGTTDLVALADFDGDDRDELVVRTHRGETRDTVAVYRGTKDGLARKPVTTFSTSLFVPRGVSK
ncbi:VCBS repeat-containing protein [Streptomyces sp. YC537]|uniref:VCBS repeat-containing protein n=1 Tax=Streptomyces boluensis TaxID=1775135 RepID=A0A964ULC6_9ACTN|nr:VCBS repeat-containing protein [Streptomyces boluensis]